MAGGKKAGKVSLFSSVNREVAKAKARAQTAKAAKAAKAAKGGGGGGGGGAAAARAAKGTKAGPSSDGSSSSDEPPSDEEDSGYDTDELISNARTSGAMKKKAKKRKAEAAAKDEKLKIDFTFFDPRENDYHGIKCLLRPFQVFGSRNEPFDTEGLADVVAAQASVGSMIKNEDGNEQPLGFSTMVSLHLHRAKKWAAQVRSAVLARAKGADKKALAAAFEDRSAPLALMLSERLINTPANLVPDLHASVLKDLEWARENEITPELRKACRYKRVLLVSRLFHNRDSEDATRKRNKRRRLDAESEEAGGGGGGGGDEPEDDGGTSYYRWEDESFDAVATARARFERPAGEHGIAQVYSVMLMPFDAFAAVVAALPRDD